MPTLHERTSDIQLLVHRFLAEFEKKFGKYIEITDAGYHILKQFNWAGNVRQLRNFCERLIIISQERVVGAEFIQEQLQMAYEEVPIAALSTHTVSEEKQIVELLDSGHYSRQQIADILEISKTTLWRKMKRYGLI